MYLFTCACVCVCVLLHIVLNAGGVTCVCRAWLENNIVCLFSYCAADLHLSMIMHNYAHHTVLPISLSLSFIYHFSRHQLDCTVLWAERHWRYSAATAPTWTRCYSIRRALWCIRLRPMAQVCFFIFTIDTVIIVFMKCVLYLSKMKCCSILIKWLPSFVPLICSPHLFLAVVLTFVSNLNLYFYLYS